MATYDSVVLYRANVCDGQGTAKGMDLGLAVNGELKQSQGFPAFGTGANRDALFTWAGKLPYYTELNELAGVARCIESGTQCKINRRQMLLLQALDPDVKFYYTYSDVEVPTPELAGDGVYYDDTEAKLTVPVDEDSLVVVLYNASPNPEHNSRTPIIKVKINGNLTSVYSAYYFRDGEENWIPFLYTFEASPGTYEIQGAFGLETGGVATSMKKRWLIAMVFPLSLKFDYWYLNDSTPRSNSHSTGYYGGDCSTYYDYTTTFNPTAESYVIFLSTAITRSTAGRGSRLWEKSALVLEGSEVGVTVHYNKGYYGNRKTISTLYATERDPSAFEARFRYQMYNHYSTCSGCGYTCYVYVDSFSGLILAFHKE